MAAAKVTLAYKNGAKRVTTRLPVVDLSVEGENMFSLGETFEILLEAYGKKGEEYFRNRGYTIAKSYGNKGDEVSIEVMEEIAKELSESFLAGRFDKLARFPGLQFLMIFDPDLESCVHDLGANLTQNPDRRLRALQLLRLEKLSARPQLIRMRQTVSHHRVELGSRKRVHHGAVGVDQEHELHAVPHDE